MKQAYFGLLFNESYQSINILVLLSSGFYKRSPVHFRVTGLSIQCHIPESTDIPDVITCRKCQVSVSLNHSCCWTEHIYLSLFESKDYSPPLYHVRVYRTVFCFTLYLHYYILYLYYMASDDVIKHVRDNNVLNLFFTEWIIYFFMWGCCIPIYYSFCKKTLSDWLCNPLMLSM